MGGPRNNLSWHPPEVRYRVYALHYEGRSGAQINADPEIAASVAQTGYRLHGNTLTAAWRSAEYKRYAAGRDKTLAATEADRITQSVLGDIGALGTVTDVARYELAREIRELIAGGALSDDESPVERVERLTRSLATVTRDDAAKIKRQLDDFRRDHEAAEAKWKAREAELLAQIQELKTAMTTGRSVAEPARVADELANILGVKK